MTRSPLQTALLERLTPITKLADGSFQASLTFDPAFPGFEGHFPGNPIVPGVCQLLLVELLAQLAANAPELRTAEIIQMKFRAPLRPNDCATFTFTLSDAPDGRTLISASAATADTPNLAKIRLALAIPA